MMGIFYCLVARGNVVLAESSAASATNASSLARQVLEKTMQAAKDNSNASYSHDRCIFHVKRTDGLTVLCMADDAFGRRLPFAFLEDIHLKFVKTYGRAILSAPAYAMNEEFSRVLSQQMDYYTNDPNADRLNRLKGEMSQLTMKDIPHEILGMDLESFNQIDFFGLFGGFTNHVQSVMIDNIEKVLDKGDRLALLVDKTTSFQGSAVRFNRSSRRFKNTLWWRNAKLMFALAAVLLVIIYVVLVFVCHGPLLASCFK